MYRDIDINNERYCGGVFVMFYERDMKLGEIIKFTGSVIKNNKKIYMNIFLLYAVWNLFTFGISFVLPETGFLSGVTNFILYIISFVMFLGIRKIIYGSLYDENYSENYDRQDIISFLKERWLKATFATIFVWLCIALLAGLIMAFPLGIIIIDAAAGNISFGFLMSVILLVIIVFTMFIIFMYYVLEINLNNNMNMAHAEVMSLFKIKKIKALTTSIPLVLFTSFMGFVSIMVMGLVCYGVGYGLGVTGNIDESALTAEGIMEAFGPVITFMVAVFLMVFCIIALYAQALWITKYYNMKNAIVYEINNGQNIGNSVEDHEIKLEDNDNKEIERVDVIKTENVNNEIIEEKEVEEKENINTNEEVVNESSMWGDSVNIEDSIIGEIDKDN